MQKDEGSNKWICRIAKNNILRLMFWELFAHPEIPTLNGFRRNAIRYGMVPGSDVNTDINRECWNACLMPLHSVEKINWMLFMLLTLKQNECGSKHHVLLTWNLIYPLLTQVIWFGESYNTTILFANSTCMSPSTLFNPAFESCWELKYPKREEIDFKLVGWKFSEFGTKLWT